MRFTSELLSAWGGPTFDTRFKSEVEQLPATALPLQQGLARTSYVSNEPFRVTLLASAATADTLQVRAGIFYSGIIAGCSCADDPTPVEAQPEYCELLFAIDRHSGAVTATLLE